MTSSYEKSSGLDRIDSKVRKEANEELEEFNKEAEIQDLQNELSESKSWMFIIGWVVLALYVIASSMVGPLLKKTMKIEGSGDNEKKFYPYNLTSIYFCSNFVVMIAAAYMNGFQNPFSGLSRKTILKFGGIRILHCIVLQAGPIVLLKLSIASDFVFGNTNLFMTAAIRFFILGTSISRSQILILSEILVLGLAYVTATKLIKDLRHWDENGKANSNSSIFTEDLFSIVLLLINKFIQSCIRVALEKVMKSDFKDKTIWAKLSLATSFDVPIYLIFMMIPIPKTGANVWKVGPFGNWHWLCGIVIICQCSAIGGIYFILSNMDAMYLTFGSFCAALLSIILAYPPFLNVDPFYLSLFVIIIGMVGLVIAYEFESGTCRYINGLLNNIKDDRTKLALVNLARFGATRKQRRSMRSLFLDEDAEDPEQEPEKPSFSEENYRNSIWIRQRAMV